MTKVAVYYKLNETESESVEMVVANIDNFIEKIKESHEVIGVFIDKENDWHELMELVNYTLSKVDLICLNKPIDDEFNSSLISQLSKSQNFEIRLFSEM